MTKRPKQHQLEDLSRNKYNLAIPRNWVMRDKDKDYGIDAEVEIFDKNDNATGLVYWIQLKATETQVVSTGKKINLSISAIKYYKSLELPVLIVRYLEKEDRFYCKWAHEIDLFYAKKGAKTRKVDFCDTDVWNENSPENTINYLNKVRAVRAGAVTLPVPVFLLVKEEAINGIPRGVLMAHLRQAIEKYPQIVVSQNDQEKAFLYAILSNDKLEISLASITYCTFHRIKDRKVDGFAKEIVDDALLGLAVNLANIGQREIAARIFLNERLKTRFFLKQDLITHCVPQIIRTSRFDEIIDSVCELIDLNENRLLETITMISSLAAMDSPDNAKHEKHQKLLNKCLAKSIGLKDNSLIGVSHYNLGNHFRSRGMHRESITHYLMARKFERKYLNQSYYYQELGGVLFSYGKHRFAANIYKLAIDKGAPESVKPLYADALMFGGYYKFAHDAFSEYLSSVEDDHFEWHLKNIYLKQLIEKTGIEEQIRLKKEALSFIDIEKAGTTSFTQGLEKAIELDNLCGLAWFNMGIEKSGTGEHEEAAFCFILCALIQTWDIEAWVNAVLCCFNQEVTIMILPLVLNTAYFFNRDNFMTKLYDELALRFSGDTHNTLSNMIDDLLINAKKNNMLPTIRVLDDDGFFRSVFTEENAEQMHKYGK